MRTFRPFEPMAEAVANFSLANFKKHHSKYHCVPANCVCSVLLHGDTAKDLIMKNVEKIFYTRGMYVSTDARGVAGQITICLVKNFPNMTVAKMALFLPTNLDEIIFTCAMGDKVFASIKVGEDPVVIYEDHGIYAGMWTDNGQFTEARTNQDIAVYPDNLIRDYRYAMSYAERANLMRAITANVEAFNLYVNGRHYEVLDKLNNTDLAPYPLEGKFETDPPSLVRAENADVVQIYTPISIPMIPELPERPRNPDPRNSPVYNPEDPNYMNDGENM